MPTTHNRRINENRLTEIFGNWPSHKAMIFHIRTLCSVGGRVFESNSSRYKRHKRPIIVVDDIRSRAHFAHSQPSRFLRCHAFGNRPSNWSNPALFTAHLKMRTPPIRLRANMLIAFLHDRSHFDKIASRLIRTVSWLLVKKCNTDILYKNIHGICNIYCIKNNRYTVYSKVKIFLLTHKNNNKPSCIDFYALYPY